MFEIKPTKLAGCFEMQLKVLEDIRGHFVKVFHTKEFAAHGLETNFVEEYYSVSSKNVIRGMHFQTPPMEHVKVVYCVQGSVLDVTVDLRIGSPTYGQNFVIELNSAKANSLYIPTGVAHGFCALSDQSIVVYKVSTIYSPCNDNGILWKSIELEWPTNKPILSARDQTFVPLGQFISPFKYE
jgi:dTDP-4-dehydrorhamnose 3,5-epimerase